MFEGVTYPSTEHAYQAAKTLDPTERAEFIKPENAEPKKAKHLGRKITFRADWDSVRLDVMETVLRQKFAAGTPLAAKLLATDDAYLEESNYWHDTFWGYCTCSGKATTSKFKKCFGGGQNNLGKLLCKLRKELQESENVSRQALHTEQQSAVLKS